jgi:F-type H+-transporting ATPase subunit gamma
VGARAAALLTSEKGTPQPDAIYPVPGSLEDIVPQSQHILASINSWRIEEGVNTVVLYHNRITSGLSYQPANVHLLPLADAWYENLIRRQWTSRSIPVFTMNRDRLFSALVRQYLFVSLYRAYTESMASENSARLSSMQAAEKNIQEKLEELTSLHRQLRQEGITSELLDIVSGFEALREA